MAWQQYSPYTSWTPLTTSDGDLGLTQPSHSEDTAYHGYGGLPYHPQMNANGGSYEMDESRRSYISSAPLLMGEEQSTYKSSIREPSLHGSKIGHGSKQPVLSGWKVGVLVCAAITTVVCLLNTALTIWAITNHRIEDGISYLYKGSCKEVANMSLWIHLGINAMSTTLLSASNYTMQVISSPTRKEVDKAHARRKWLDIGVPSTKNLRAISWSRVFMWTILGLSSVPLHLMYNTAVFSSLSANAYKFMVVSKNFLGPQASGITSESKIIQSMRDMALNGKLVNYTSSQCIEAYSNNFVSNIRNVLLITGDNDSNNRSLLYSNKWDSYDQIPYAWLCGDGWSYNPYTVNPPKAICTSSVALSKVSSWTLNGNRIKYCLVQEVTEQCQLSFSLYIMLVVIAVNISKASIMILTVWKLREPTLVTIGDAAASFLREPDHTTKGICLASKADIERSKWSMQPAKPWRPKRSLWFRSASLKRWLTCNVLCLGAIAFGIYLYSIGTSGLGITDIATLYSLGFGTVSASSIVSVAPKGLLATTLFANLPQAILSFLYLTYNGLFSCMLGAYEWSRFARVRKPLRVSRPVGKQRSTYYLQLPYTYAIPLLLMSGGLHWLMSQSLFLALVTVYDHNGEQDQSASISTVGYSCIAIFCALILGSIAVLGGIANGFRRYDDGIPLVGSCSAAISAACHRPMEDSTAYLKAVMWGVVKDNQNGDQIGHCSISSFEVEKPVVGSLYAG